MRSLDQQHTYWVNHVLLLVHIESNVEAVRAPPSHKRITYTPVPFSRLSLLRFIYRLPAS